MRPKVLLWRYRYASWSEPSFIGTQRCKPSNAWQLFMLNVPCYYLHQTTACTRNMLVFCITRVSNRHRGYFGAWLTVVREKCSSSVYEFSSRTFRENMRSLKVNKGWQCSSKLARAKNIDTSMEKRKEMLIYDECWHGGILGYINLCLFMVPWQFNPGSHNPARTTRTVQPVAPTTPD